MCPDTVSVKEDVKYAGANRARFHASKFDDNKVIQVALERQEELNVPIIERFESFAKNDWHKNKKDHDLPPLNNGRRNRERSGKKKSTRNNLPRSKKNYFSNQSTGGTLPTSLVMRDPQNPITLTEFFASNVPEGMISDDSVKKFIGTVENTFLLLGTLHGCSEPSAMLCAFGQFAKLYVSDSVLYSLYEYIKELTAPPETNQNAGVVPEGDENGFFYSFIKALRAAKDDWTSVMVGPLSAQVSKFLALLVTLGICEASSVTFDFKGFKLIEPDLTKEIKTAPNLIAACLDTSLYFLETTYKSWKAGSVTPFLLGDTDAVAMDEEYAWVNKNWAFIKCGNEERSGVTKKEFDCRVDKLAKRYKLLVASSTGYQKSVADRRFVELVAIVGQSLTMDMSSCQRKLPFSFGLFGGSGVGKTTMAKQFLDAICHCTDVKYGNDYTFILKEGSKFWDTWKNHMTCIIADDFKNKKNAKNDESTNVLIDIVNRVPYRPPMAAIEEKENSDCRPYYFVATGHDRTMGAFESSINPKSIQRRVAWQLQMNVKEEFSRFHNESFIGIDDDKIHAYYTDANGNNIPRLVDDIATYTVTQVVDSPHGDQYLANYEIVTFNGKKMEDISGSEALAFLTDKAIEHWVKEDKMIARIKNNTPESFGMCLAKGCKHFASTCPHHGLEPGGPNSPAQNVDIESHSSTDSIKEEENEDADSDYSVIYEDESLTPSMIHDMENQSWSASALKYALSNTRNKISKNLTRKYFFSDKAGSAVVHLGARKLWKYFDWMKFLPSCIVRNDQFHETLMLIDADRIYDHFVREVRYACLHVFASGCLFASTFVPRFKEFWLPFRVPYYWETVTYHQGPTLWFHNRFYLPPSFAKKECIWRFASPKITAGILFAGSIAMTAMVVKGRVEDTKRRYIAELNSRNDVTQVMNQQTRDQVVLGIATGIGAAATMYAALKAIRQMQTVWNVGFEKWMDGVLGLSSDTLEKDAIGTKKPKKLVVHEKNFTEQGGVLSPCTKEDIEMRNSVVSEWKDPVLVKIEMTDKSRTMVPEQLQTVLSKHLVYAQFQETLTSEPFDWSNVVFIGPNIVAYPWHYMRDRKRFYIRCVRNDEPNSTNHEFTIKIERELSYHPEGTDLVFSYVSRCGAIYSDISHVFPCDNLTEGSDHMFRMLYRTNSGEVQVTKGVLKVRDISIKGNESAYPGASYTVFNGKVFPGLCGAMIMSTGNGCCAMGMHTAGRDNTPEGACCQITQKHISEAKEFLSKKPGVLLLSDPTPIPKTMLGKAMIQEGTIHPKNFVNFQTEHTHMVPVAVTTPSPPMKSNFKVLPIKDSVEREFDYEFKHHKPLCGAPWKGIQMWNEKARKPSVEVDYEILGPALEQMIEDYCSIFNSDLWTDRRPLTLEETLNGVKGHRFLRRLNMRTAPGVPFSGNKWKFVKDPDAEVLEFTDEVAELFNECDAKLARGESLGFLAKQFSKDEPQTKVKVRKIYVNNLMTNLLVRKYYLPLIEIIQMNPLHFSCAVGINARSPEWAFLMDHMEKYGIERILAGDFSGFDATVSSQLLICVLTILNRMAWYCQYSARDLTCMKALARDLVHPYVDVDGVVFMFLDGVLISGIPLTVILNSFINDLLKRCFFEKEYPGKKFKENYSGGNYGDDDKGSVGVKTPKLNCIGYGEWLKSIGFKWTTPDKDEVTKEYLHTTEADFLKRNSVYHDELGLRIGALSHESMMRMLCCVTYSKGSGLSLEDMSVINITTALDESFAHGPEFYEEFRDKVVKIAKEHDIYTYVASNDVPYSIRAREWKEKHLELAKNYFKSKGQKLPRTYHGVTPKVEVEEMDDWFGHHMEDDA